MAYPPSDPAANKTDATPAATDHPAHHNALANAIVDIVDVLGDDPAGDSANVQARFEALNGTFVSSRAGLVYVEPVGGSDSNDGLTPSKAFATGNAAIAALGATGGTILLSSGVHAPITIDSTVTQRWGLRFVGMGERRTFITATQANEDACKLIPATGREITNLSFEGISFTGSTSGTVTGHGVNLGGGVWPAIGKVKFENCRMYRNGKAGVFGLDINEFHFDTCEIRENGTYGVYVSGNTADGDGGTVMRGNTCVFTNTNVHSNASGGYYFDRAGNSWTIIGGELHSHTAGDAVTVVPGTSFRGLNFIGTHFEGNQRAVHLGDNNATGLATNISFFGCHFTNQTGAYDVFLDGSENVTFERCQFGASTAGVKVSNTALNRYRLIECKGVNGTKLVEDRAGTVYNAAQDFSWGGRVRLINDSSGHADNVSSALVYMKNTQAAAFFEELADATGSVKRYMGAGTPEGVVSAPVGSIFHRRDGAADSCLYVKESGTGNTGWSAVSPTVATRLWVPASQLATLSGSPAIGVNSGRIPRYNLDAASAEAIGGYVQFPSDWATYNVAVWWSNSGAGSGDVVFRWDAGSYGAGDTIASPSSGTQRTKTAPAQNVVQVDTLESGLSTTSAKRLNFALFRMAVDAADTLANDAGVIGLAFTKAS